jgi:putative glutamine amidotransferase
MTENIVKGGSSTPLTQQEIDRYPVTKDGLKIGTTDSAFISAFRRFWPETFEITDERIIPYLDLMIIPGGGDVEPARYGYKDNGLCYPDYLRDKKEFNYFDIAQKNQINIFGVCRGLQLINVAMGGTLYVDLRMNGKIHNGDHELNWVTNSDGTIYKSKLHATLPKVVNSYHHQGIQRLAGSSGLVTVAAWQGVPEIIIGGLNIIATQFHPEMMSETKPFFDLLTSWCLHSREEKKEKETEPEVATVPTVSVTISKKSPGRKDKSAVAVEAATEAMTSFATAVSNTTPVVNAR